MNARWRVLVILLLGLSVSACTATSTILDRGTTIPIEKLYERRNDLTTLVIEEFSMDEPHRAFYVLEAHKSSRLAALTSADRRGESYDDIAELVATNPGSKQGTDRGLKLVTGTLKPRVKRDQKLDTDAFWQEQKDVAKRFAELEKGSRIPYDLAMKGEFLLATAEEMLQSAGKQQVFVSYYVGAKSVWSVVIGARGIRAQRIALTPPELGTLVERLTDGVRQPMGTEWRRYARLLYDALVVPLEADLADAKAITVIPDGVLSNLPFALLLAPDDQLLIQRMRVSYLPSASFYRALLNRPLFTEQPRMLILGNAAYPKPWQPLPAAEEEARALEHLFPDPLLLVGKAATEQRFYDAYRAYNIHHFATHGMLTGTLGGRASSLVLTSDSESDGYLSAGEISSLDLSRSYLTVLSACETAATGEQQSNLDSIAAAFLSAGSPTVIGSQWAVSDVSTALLMLRFYEAFLVRGNAEALRQAQLSFLKGDYAHPYFWAAFVLYGWDR